MLYHIKIALIALIVLVFAGCSTTSIPYSGSDFESTPNTSKRTQEATMRPYTINGKTYYPTVVEVGDSATAAHKTRPMNTMVKVTSLKNGKTTIVRINDRGPFVAGRIIDLSKAAATEISMIADGTAPVRLEVIGFYGQIETPANKTAKTHTYTGGNFVVQIGAFRRLEGANTYKAQFDNTNGIYKTAVREYTLNNEPIYRVFLTGFRSEAEARDFISSGQFKGAFIARD